MFFPESWPFRLHQISRPGGAIIKVTDRPRSIIDQTLHCEPNEPSHTFPDEKQLTESENLNLPSLWSQMQHPGKIALSPDFPSRFPPDFPYTQEYCSGPDFPPRFRPHADELKPMENPAGKGTKPHRDASSTTPTGHGHQTDWLIGKNGSASSEPGHWQSSAPASPN